MAEVNSAGTIVAAVLENAGYVTHAYILTWFDKLWISGGGLIYTLTAMGAVLSVVLFNSYRWGRYLLVGPGIFWFLVGARVDASAVVYKLGGGEAKSVEHVFVGPLEHHKPTDDNLKVSWFFYWFANLTSNVTNEFVDVILNHEDDEDLFMASRRQVLSFFLQTKPDDAELSNILTNSLFNKCEQMVDHSVALADQRFSDRNFEELEAWATEEGSTDAAENLQRLRQEKTRMEAQYTEASKQRVLLEGETQKFVSKRVENNHFILPANTTYPLFFRKYFVGTPEFPQYNADPKNFVLRQLAAGMNVECGDLWKISLHALINEGQESQKRIFEVAMNPPLTDTPAHRNLFCQQIAESMHRDFVPSTGGDCDLAQTAAVFMLHRMLTTQELSRTISRTKSRAKLKGDQTKFVDLRKMTDVNVRFDDRAQTVFVDGKNRRTRFNQQDQVAEIEVPNETTGALEWIPVHIANIEGAQRVAWAIQQRFESQKLLQTIYSYAMNLPYWQGVMLYFIAVAYPFMTLLVLMPSRALAFTAVPLSWMWVKSWDVGFAVVMILDKILWRLLPSTEFGYQAATVVENGQPLAGELPEIVRNALALDPSYDIHAHYHIISSSLFAVPMITGYAILKARRSVLASFTQAPQKSADRAGGLASMGHGIVRQNREVAALNSAASTARFATTRFGAAGGMEAGGRGQAASQRALQAGLARAGAGGLPNTAGSAITRPISGNRPGGHGHRIGGLSNSVSNMQSKIATTQGKLSSATGAERTKLQKRLGAQQRQLKKQQGRLGRAQGRVGAARAYQGLDIVHGLADSALRGWERYEQVKRDLTYQRALRDQAWNYSFEPTLSLTGVVPRMHIQILTAMDGSKGGENQNMPNAAQTYLKASADLRLTELFVEEEIYRDLYAGGDNTVGMVSNLPTALEGRIGRWGYGGARDAVTVYFGATGGWEAQNSSGFWDADREKFDFNSEFLRQNQARGTLFDRARDRAKGGEAWQNFADNPLSEES